MRQVVALGLLFLLGGCERKVARPTPAPSIPALAEQLSTGAQVYEQNCAQCHYAGEGSTTAPPLTGSQVLRSDSAGLAKIILQGQRNQSVVNGQKFNGIMPAMPYLSDEEVASVSAYLRNRFAETSEPVSPAEVAKVRQSLGE